MVTKTHGEMMAAAIGRQAADGRGVHFKPQRGQPDYCLRTRGGGVHWAAILLDTGNNGLAKTRPPPRGAWVYPRSPLTGKKFPPPLRAEVESFVLKNHKNGQNGHIWPVFGVQKNCSGHFEIFFLLASPCKQTPEGVC